MSKAYVDLRPGGRTVEVQCWKCQEVFDLILGDDRPRWPWDKELYVMGCPHCGEAVEVRIKGRILSVPA